MLHSKHREGYCSRKKKKRKEKTLGDTNLMNTEKMASIRLDLIPVLN